MRLLRPELASNAFAREIDATLPRVLALIDRDPLSQTRGFGDRQFWGWKLIDFPNGTLQGAVNGLTALLAADAFAPHVSRDTIRARVDDQLAATIRMMRRDGSFEEALPHEQSYCVTALCAYDYLRAADRLGLSAEALRPLAPAIDFLVRRDETHAFIANHLATAVAALSRWAKLTGDGRARDKARHLLDRILDAQSPEGWFPEYGGADPGYQTLCMGHLADAAEVTGDERLRAALVRSAEFASLFVHPDGSFGGIYGSRATRIYYPAGMELVARRSDAAAWVATKMRAAIGAASTVPLTAIDQPNLLPLFNSYCEALAASAPASAGQGPSGRHWMPQAGLLVDIGESHHTVVSTRKGGVVYHWRDGALVTCNTGIALRGADGKILTSQSDLPVQAEVNDGSVHVSGKLTRRAMPLPNAFNFLVLRMLALSVMRIPAISAWIKKSIAGMLTRSGGSAHGTFERTITLGRDVTISDSWQPSGLTRIVVAEPFSTIHMASSGYWQAGDTTEQQERQP